MMTFYRKIFSLNLFIVLKYQMKYTSQVIIHIYITGKNPSDSWKCADLTY